MTCKMLFLMLFKAKKLLIRNRSCGLCNIKEEGALFDLSVLPLKAPLTLMFLLISELIVLVCRKYSGWCHVRPAGSYPV